MLRLIGSVETKRSPEEVFAHVADIGRMAEWDPTVASITPVNGNVTRLGAQFDVLLRLALARVPMRYTVTHYEPPHSITIHGVRDTVRAIDTITFDPLDDGGTRVTYSAKLSIKSESSHGDRLMVPAMRRLIREAMQGLSAAIGGHAVQTSATHVADTEE